VDMNLPVEGGFHNLAIVSIKKSYPGHAKKVMNALWGLGHMMMLTRVLVNVDDLDHGSYTPALGTKIGVDATRKDASEG
ncbi:UbiD family decarboxylase, partial [Klebsiella pneumoniae]